MTVAELPTLLTAEQVAEIFSVDREWVRRYFSEGKVRLGHKTYRWKKDAVLKWLETR